MQKLQNPMEIWKLLDRSNCWKCNEKTCLAFASAVYLGKKKLNDCPHIDQTLLESVGFETETRRSVDEEQEKKIVELMELVKKMDMSATAARIGGKYANHHLIFQIMGKDFRIGQNFDISTDIHVNPWLLFPVLSYIINCKSEQVEGKWVSFKDLKSGRTWHGLFRQRCEFSLKKVVDTYPDLFEDMIHIFKGKPLKNYNESDISLMLKPLPKVPVLICYWKPEAGLESDLILFFDKTAEDNCGIEGLYALGAGLVQMFEKISLRHGQEESQ